MSNEQRLIQTDAMKKFASVYPFEPSGGGLGVVLTCTDNSGSSSRLALVGAGPVIVLTNTGQITGFFAYGTSSIVATTAHFPVLPDTQWAISIPQDGTVTHVAGITSGEEGTTLSVHLGTGN